MGTEGSIQKIEMLIKALGTMVMIPSYESNPDQIGSKTFTGTIQQPIIIDKDREIAINKLTELIKEL